jgi:hypothetical protein
MGNTQLFLGNLFSDKVIWECRPKTKRELHRWPLEQTIAPPFDSQHPHFPPRSQHVAEMGEDVVALGFPLGQNSLKISKGAHERLQKGHPQIGLFLIQKL